MKRIPSAALLAALMLGAGAAGAAEDVVAMHARLVAAGKTVVASLLEREAAREAYDKEGDRISAADKALQQQIEAQNAAQKRFADEAIALVAAVKQHNADCGAGAAKVEPKQFKDKDAFQAAKDAETARVAGCDAQAEQLKQRQQAQDAEQARLKTAHDDLTKRVAAQNASADAIAARGGQLNDQLAQAQDAAEDWRAKLTEVLLSPAFGARAGVLAGCKARREMVVSGKDLSEFLSYQETCAKNLAAHR